MTLNPLSCHSRKFLAGIQGLGFFFVHEDERHWIHKYTGSPIKTVGDKRRE